MNVLSIPIIMIAGVSLFVGFYYLFIYYRRQFKYREDLTFALTCLSMGVFCVLSFGEYNAKSVTEGIFWQRTQVATLSLIGVVFVWFITDYLGLNLKWFRNLFSAYFLFSAIFIFIDRSTLTFNTAQPVIKKIVFPLFDFKATFFEVEPGPVTNFTGLIGVLFLICTFIISARQYRLNKGFRTRSLCIAISIFMAGLCNDVAVHDGLYQFIYIIEYTYMAIILLMVYSLSNTIVESAIVKEELVREQYLMNALMNTMTDNIYFKDKDSKFIRINKSLADWFGIGDPEEAAGKTDFDFFSDEHAKQAYEGEQKILQTGKPLKSIEEKETWPDGRETWVSTTKAPLLDIHGNIAGTFGISRDITDRKLIEEAFKKAKAELDKKAKELAISNEALTKSNQELEQFAYVASHDLQEPLRMISSYLSLITRRYSDKLEKDGKEFIDYAVDGAKRMQVMINDLLQYSRVTTKGKAFEKTNMEDVLEKVLMNLKIAIEESSGVINHDKLPDIIADRVQMERLLQNLLGNAIKYRGDRKPKVHVSVKRKKGEYVFMIEDNGIGIEEEYREKIFGIFQRLHTREEYQGTGIGLAVCKKIVERHGGKIWIDGKFNEGSTFYFTIPKKQDRI